MEPFGFIHYHLFCPFRIKYFILLTNIDPKMYLSMHVNDHKIQDMGV